MAAVEWEIEVFAADPTVDAGPEAIGRRVEALLGGTRRCR